MLVILRLMVRLGSGLRFSASIDATLGGAFGLMICGWSARGFRAAGEYPLDVSSTAASQQNGNKYRSDGTRYFF
jgi:hypothetical protein